MFGRDVFAKLVGTRSRRLLGVRDIRGVRSMNQQPVREKRKSRPLSLAVVTFCYLFGGLMILGYGAQLAIMLWFNLKYGPIVPHAESTRNALAMTPLNLLFSALSLGIGAGLCVMARSIWSRNQRRAIAAFLVVVACGIGWAAAAPYAGDNSYKDPFRSTEHG